MIKSIINENILESPAKCLVNTVNCEGFMGKGIAYQFKQAFPENNKHYMALCKNKQLTIGDILFFEEKDKIIANFPTKDKWREKSQYIYIEKGLDTLCNQIQKRQISSIAIPPLGCGNGGLNWNQVKELINSKLALLNIDIYLYEPSAKYVVPKRQISKIYSSHLLLIKMKSLLNKINRLRLQKSAFFLNLFSNSEYFRFDEYKFGPFSQAVNVLFDDIKAFQESYHVTTNEAEQIMYNKIVSNNVKETVNKYMQNVLQATNFVNSMNSDHDLEVAATIVAIVKKHPDCNQEKMLEYFFKWPKYDKSRFTNEEIEKVTNNLIRSNIIQKDLLGYNISDDIRSGNSLMYRYIE